MEIQFSARMTALLLSIHMLVAIVMWFTTMPPAIRFTLMLLTLLSLLYYLARDVFLLLPNSWREFRVGQAEQIIIFLGGSKLPFQILGQTIASPYLVLLRVRVDGQRWPTSRIIFPDALADDLFRQLCVRLKFRDAL